MTLYCRGDDAWMTQKKLQALKSRKNINLFEEWHKSIN